MKYICVAHAGIELDSLRYVREVLELSLCVFILLTSFPGARAAVSMTVTPARFIRRLCKLGVSETKTLTKINIVSTFSRQSAMHNRLKYIGYLSSQETHSMNRGLEGRILEQEEYNDHLEG